MTTLDSALESAKYCSIRSFRRDGRSVDTPVWFAAGEGRYYLFSAGDAGKVKRIRNNAHIEVAPCDLRGNVQGAWSSGSARVLNAQADIDAALAALHRKYGLVMWFFDLGSRIGGKFHKRAYVTFDLSTS